MTQRFLPLLLVCGVVTTSGCFKDDLDLRGLAQCSTDSPDLPRSDVVAPLAVGARLVAFTDRSDAAGNVIETLTLTSSNTDVLEVTPEAQGVTKVLAVGPGTAEIVVHRASGMEHGRLAIEVRAHDTFTLHSRREMLAGATFEEALVTAPRIVQDAPARFYLRAFAQGTELQVGGSLLDVSVESPTVSRMTLSPASVELSALTDGDHEVPVQFLDGFFSPRPELGLTVTVRGVSASSATSVALVAPDETGAAEDDCLTAVAIARDIDGELVEGAEVSFTVARTTRAIGEGEVLNYAFRAEETVEAEAHLNGVRASATLHTTLEAVRSGSVATCSAGGAGSHTVWTVVLLATAVAFTRRVRTLVMRARA